MIPRRRIHATTLLLLATLGCGPEPARPGGPATDRAASRPHLLVIVADDLGWADVGYRSNEIATPHLDALAEEGAILERFYAMPLCTPSRAALLTGRSPARSGLLYRPLRPWDTKGLPEGEVLLPEVLRDHGYATALVGKWHLGHGRQRLWPRARGFDHFYGLLTGAHDYFTHARGLALDWQRNGETVVEEGYSTTLLGEEAVRLIEAHDRAQPLFLLLAFNAPHTPLQAPPEIEARFASIENPRRRTYAAMVAAMDDAIGAVLAALDRSAMAEDTLVLFLSDNGGARKEAARNTPLRGDKGTTFEGGIRVPAVLRWPGRVRPGEKLHQWSTVQDVFPTLLDAAGAEAGAVELDGRSLLAPWTGGPQLDREALFFASHDERFVWQAVIDGGWKLLRRTSPQSGEAIEFLFDLRADPIERNELQSREGERLAALRDELDDWLARWEGAQPPREVGMPEGWEPPASWTEVPE